MNNLLTRSISAIVFVAIMVTGIVWNQWSLLVLVTLINTVLLFEFFKLFKNKFKTPVLYYVILGDLVLLLPLIILYINQGHAFIFIVPLLIFFVFITELSNLKSFSFLNSAIVLSGWIYISVPLILFTVTGNALSGFTLKYTLPLLIFVWINDVFAYLIGSKFGKTKITPHISPNKSLEGAIGGFIFTLLSSLIWMKIFPEIIWVHWLILSCIASFFCVLGDLIISKLKRDLGIKDTGNIMPGHGGLLDRFDGFLFATPFYYIYLIIFVI